MYIHICMHRVTAEKIARGQSRGGVVGGGESEVPKTCMYLYTHQVYKFVYIYINLNKQVVYIYVYNMCTIFISILFGVYIGSRVGGWP